MILLLWDAIWLLDALIFGGLIFLVMTAPRRRGPYDVYAADTNMIIIHEPTGETITLRTIIDTSPKVLVQFHYAEELRNTSAWGSPQDVFAEIQLIDCEVQTLGTARTKTVFRGGQKPTWSLDRGLVTIVLPANQLDLGRISLNLQLKAAHAWSQPTLIAHGCVGTLKDIVHGNPVETTLQPHGKVVLSAITSNVNQPPIAIARQRTKEKSELPVAVAQPLSQPTLPGSL